MSPSRLSESTVEAAALDWFESLGWSVAHGPDIVPDTPGADTTWSVPGCAIR